MAPTSALPIGATRSVSEMQPIQVNPAQVGSGLYNAVLAVLAPPNPDESERYDEEILDLHVVCFVVVYVPILPHSKVVTSNSILINRTAVDIPNKRMTILAPGQQSALAGRTAIVGSFEWQE